MEKVETYKQQPPLPLQQQQPPPPPPPQKFDDSMVYGKIMKKKQKKKKRLNNQMRRSVYYPKSPLMIFSELFKDIPIHLQEHPLHNACTSYTATLEIDGQMYYGNDISMTEAKEEACENFFRFLLAKKLSEQSESPMNAEMEFEANRPSKEKFPWPHFLSLAMHNLLSQWNIQPVESFFFEPQPKIVAMSVFPKNPKNYNPIKLLYLMKPELKFTKITVHKLGGNCLLQVNCVIDDILFTGQGSKTKAAKKECCIAAIKYFWQFDFHAKENN